MISLEIAQDKDRTFFHNAFNMYQNELGQHTGEYSFLDEEGFFDRNTVDVYFEGSKAVRPFLIKDDERRIGVVVITTAPCTRPGTAFCIQELFLIASSRGRGLALEAVRKLIQEYDKDLCLQVLKLNERAKAFWTKVAGSLSMAIEKEDAEDCETWILRKQA
ncbi:MAG: GNAT family N-acetyltransferase [Sphaerochaetaceae bacterium]|jgi:predicted acetyltransferase|nr:GNAT family N-acetyltransferase [Sphaerochaetaceae bacterium]